MSSRAKKVEGKLVEQRLATVVQVLSIMESEAEKMNWFQRFAISWDYLWKKNINVFFKEAKKNE